jgi:TolA-binding protein
MRPLLSLLLAPALVAAQVPEGRLTDVQAGALAREALTYTRPAQQAEALKALRKHHFKSSLVPEREVALFAQGTLEDRLGDPARAAATFHKLEQAWPRSPYLAEAQVVIAEVAAERKRYKEAESRLQKALGAEIPLETARRCQELLLWCLAEQGRAAEGEPILRSLKPLGTGKPSERGLVGMLETLCAHGRKAEAEAVAADYRKFYPRGPRLQRVNLLHGKLLGSQGEPLQAAHAFQRIIRDSPRSPEADEARLALATLLTNGRLTPKEKEAFPAPRVLLAGVKGEASREGAAQATLVKLRLAIQEGRWREALDLAAQNRNLRLPEGEKVEMGEFRAQAVRGWAQSVVEKGRPGPLLPYLDGEAIRTLTPALRQGLVERLAQGGLPEACRPIIALAPPKERTSLQNAALQATPLGTSPEGALALPAGKGEGPLVHLARAQAAAARRAWPQLRAALAKARPGPERIRLLLLLLGRPADKGEAPGARPREAAQWLARAPEKGPDREPLAIQTADLLARQGDWRGALALYPPSPTPAQRAWVALMRATCQQRLGQTEAARATLRTVAAEPAFKVQRDALAQRLARP